ncbi:MAG: hypothetical protein C4576_05720 [Desulfobacteraceae bacterium]|nr:MAG: hypothetical protein C4576_05720 [Desulfobacteraceae bacterium]
MRIRDRGMTLIPVAGLAVIGVLYHLLVVGPALSKQVKLDEYIGRKKAETAKMLQMKNQWEIFQASRSEAERILRQRGEGFTLLTYLEGVSRESGIEKKIRYMKPISISTKDELFSPECIEMQLEDVDMQHLVEFLYKIEQSKRLLIVDRAKIRPVSKGNERLLELTLQVKTYRIGEQNGERS